MQEIELKFAVTTGLASLVFALTGCTATGPIFQEAASAPEGKGLVYLYRPSSLALAARSAKFFVSGQKIAELNTNGYTAVYLPEGHHVILQRWADNEYPALMANIVGPTKPIAIPLDVKAGDTHYIRFTTGPGEHTYGTIAVAWRIEQVSPAFGSREITETRYEPASQ
ncbi:DUF2846 domain-containing protein [Massilia sp. YMA4]|uniref:DUF2846 domain-containing protein n=1 Tax=Massilia sp. YMA4 TaxID=1593482 RepID=UPI000DD12A6A|nr:DUF2846 domain-containing protein [Massilia sp. YMA4]AXA92695.1 hypothetical protein DPH57_17000 [Massilia sp. YMA4]